MRIAIVFDDLIQNGGAEELFKTSLEIWPEAEVFTSVISPKWASYLKDRKFIFHTSFLQKFPYAIPLNRFYGALLLHVLAFRTFNFEGYDVVISISSRFAHLITTKSTTKHVVYLNSPGRMFWEPYKYFRSEKIPSVLFIPFLSAFRLYDYAAIRSADYLIANSKTPQMRVKKYYGLESSIIYPFVDLENINRIRKELFPDGFINKEPYFVLLGRLLPWKRFDYVISTFNNFGMKLKVLGTGPDLKRLKSLSTSNIEFMGYVSEVEKVKLLSKAQGMIVPQHEDFGIAPLESMACGTPVIAYGRGGVLETVLNNQTGCFYEEQSVPSLLHALENYNISEFSFEKCYAQALQYSRLRFVTELRSFIEKICE